jgi:hypothetical protein
VVKSGQAKADAWNPAELPAGDYRLRIIARDFAGNEAIAGNELRLRLR